MSEKVYRVQSCAHCPYMRWCCCHPSLDPHQRKPPPLAGIPDWCPLEDAPEQPDERIAALSQVAAELEELCEDASSIITEALDDCFGWRKAAAGWRDRWYRWSDDDAPEKEPAA